MQVRYVKIGEFGQISGCNSKTSHVYHTERHDTIRYDTMRYDTINYIYVHPKAAE